MFIFCLIGFYLQVQVLMPYGLYIITGGASLLVAGASRAQARLIGYFIGLAGLSIALVALDLDRQSAFFEQFSSFGLLGLTMLASLGFYRAAVSVRRDVFARLFFVASFVIVAAAILELAGPLAPISNAFRLAVYPDRIIYSNELRDLSTFGFVRPKVFTSEPSHAGKLLGVFLACAFLTSDRWLLKAVICILGVVGYAVIGSSAILGGLSVILSSIVIDIGGRIFKHGRNPMLSFVGLPLLAALLLGALLLGVGSSRLGVGGGVVEASAFLRLYAPFLMAQDVINSHPFFGYGIGADSTIRSLYYSAVFTEWAPELVRSSNFDKSGLTYGNMHGGLLIQFGVLGGVLWLISMRQLFLVMAGAGEGVFWVFYVVYGWLVAPLNTPIFWGGIVLISAALRLRVMVPNRYEEPDLARAERDW